MENKKIIADFLSANKIKHKYNHRDKRCVNPVTGEVMVFDINLYELNAYIDFDTNNKIKQEFCKNNGIHLFNDKDYTKLLELEPLFEIYDQEMYEKDIQDLIKYIESFKYKKIVIYSIYRGSIMVTHRLTNELNANNNFGIIQFQSYDGNDKKASFIYKPEIDDETGVFVIDDIYDTGNTINKVKKLFDNDKTHFITLYSTKDTDEVFYLRKNTKYVKFLPWEGY